RRVPGKRLPLADDFPRARMRDPFARAIADGAALMMFVFLAGKACRAIALGSGVVEIRRLRARTRRIEDAPEHRRGRPRPRLEIGRPAGADDARERHDEAVALGAEREHDDVLPACRRWNGMAVAPQTLVRADEADDGARADRRGAVDHDARDVALIVARGQCPADL